MNITTSNTAANYNPILVVDDDVEFCDSLSELIESNGYYVEKANSAIEAETIVSEKDINFVLLDVQLGEDNGLDLIEYFKIKKQDIVFIIMTAYTDVDTVLNCMRKGVCDFLQKPFNEFDLLSALGRCIELHELNRGKLEAENAVSKSMINWR